MDNQVNWKMATVVAGGVRLFVKTIVAILLIFSLTGQQQVATPHRHRR